MSSATERAATGPEDDGPPAGQVGEFTQLLTEHRTFPPEPAFAAAANAALYGQAEADPEAFWAEQAAQLQCGASRSSRSAISSFSNHVSTWRGG